MPFLRFLEEMGLGEPTGATSAIPTTLAVVGPGESAPRSTTPGKGELTVTVNGLKQRPITIVIQ